MAISPPKLTLSVGFRYVKDSVAIAASTGAAVEPAGQNVLYKILQVPPAANASYSTPLVVSFDGVTKPYLALFKNLNPIWSHLTPEQQATYPGDANRDMKSPSKQYAYLRSICVSHNRPGYYSVKLPSLLPGKGAAIIMPDMQYPIIASATDYNVHDSSTSPLLVAAIQGETEYLDPIPPDPGLATIPSPANSATGVSVTPTLSWTSGPYATSHHVLFGTDDSSLTDNGAQSATTFNPGTLSSGTPYYWRINEVSELGGNTYTKAGTLWSFTTA